MEKTDIKKELWHSLDMAVLRRDTVLFLIADLIFVLITGVFQGGFWEPGYGVLVAVFSVLILGPALIYDICVTVKLFRHPDRYRLYRAQLNQPHGARWGRGAMYFTVLLEDEDGRFVVNTRPIFASYGIGTPLMEDYLNKTATIAYNEETEAVVIIR